MFELEDIRKTILKVLEASAPGSNVILFGSRVKGKARIDSDYDFVIVVPDIISIATQKQISSEIRKKLAENEIDADIIVQPRKKFEELRIFPGNVSHWADTEGIAI